MTQNLKIEVLTGDISIDGMVVTNLVTKEELSQVATKKADLGADGKIPTNQLPDNILNTTTIVDQVKTQLETSIKDAVDESNAYAESYTDNALSSKADLESGKVPLEQLPSIDQYPQFGTSLNNLSTTIMKDVRARTDELEKTKASLGEDGKVLRELIPSYEKISGLPEQLEVMTTQTAAVSKELGEHKVQAADQIDVLKENIEANVQQLADRQSHLMRTYATKELGVDANVGVKPGEYFYVRSANEEEVTVEYQNVGGVPTPSGKSYPSGSALTEVREAIIDSETGKADASKLFDGDKNQKQINDYQKLKNKDLVSVKDFGAKGDGVTDDAPIINAHIVSTEVAEKANSYFYFPNFDESYLVNSPIEWRYGGILIFGFKGGSYENGFTRKGNIVVNNTNCGFNIGADRSIFGISNGWEVRNIGFVQHPSLPERSADAIRISAKTDGPDRGIKLYGIHSKRMNRGVYIPSNSATVMAGTLVIENCYLNNNNYALVIDQKVEGLRFVGNQAEQNQIGGIDVVINGGVTITDNMLEGQKNAINIRGIKPKVEIKRNYFEANSGDYVVQFSAVSLDSSIEMSGNYAVVIAENTDYLRIVNNQYNYAYKVVNEDLYPATFVDDANITPDSRIVNRQINYYYIKSFNGSNGVKVYNENWSHLATDNSYTQMTIRGDSASRFVDTPFGKRQIPKADDYFVAGMNVAQGDMIAINCLFKVVETSDSDLGTSGIALRVYDQAVKLLTDGIWGSAYITSALSNRYILFSGVIKANRDATAVLFQIFNSERDIQMIGACAKNLGQFTGKFKHRQVMPSFESEFVGTDPLSSVVIADGVRTTRTVTVTGARLGQFVDVSFTANQVGVNIYGFVTAPDTVTVVLENRTGASQTLTGTLRVKAKKAW